MQDISKHDMDIAWSDDGIPLSDLIHGIYCMVPPELLHTTCEGITQYMIEIFKDITVSADWGDDIQQLIEHLH